MSVEDITKLKKKRGGLRTSITRILKKIELELDKSSVDINLLEEDLELLNDKFESLKIADSEIESTLKPEEFDEEIQTTEECRERILLWKFRAKKRIHLTNQNFTVIDTNLYNSQIFNDSSKRKFKLLKIEFKLFGGDIKERLSFWAQFQKIHNDKEIAKEDKYQYLLQATLKGSRARELVESFRATADSYENVIECLKTRFGRTDMLIEVYIREVFSLMMNNAIGKGSKMPLFKLYDKIESYLRSLNMLGVSSANYSSILYPLIESCLPVDILRVWERNLNSTSLTSKEETVDKLDNLMKFLCHEIESEEKVRLARTEFNRETEIESKIISPALARRERFTPTAAELCNASDIKKETCVFCNKAHMSSQCRYADNLPYKEKTQMLLKRGACFRCSAVRKHISRFCTMKVPPCEICGKGHFKLMCTEKCNSENSNRLLQVEEKQIKSKDSALSNKTATRKVLLQTLIVRLRNKNKRKYIRVLIDSGNSKSYLSNFAIMEMGYECIGEEILTHSLFSGIETTERHKRYLIRLSNFSDNYRCIFEMLNQENICSEIPKIPCGTFMIEVKKYKIVLSDLNDKVDLLYQFSPDEIHGLVGADVVGKLYTGNIKQLDSV
ncbi:uncharacterized protein LOC118188022 [Stegodyphus dumicola]|uniref:uncharacterized protein LOC118188022 n=1 Tax=Stegodyphus dumicola TaxID=202533 RepID=UPI0015B32861|nr:uncharacterized protein LOC118188022 [Stegodyphus dumicola]